MGDDPQNLTLKRTKIIASAPTENYSSTRDFPPRVWVNFLTIAFPLAHFHLSRLLTNVDIQASTNASKMLGNVRIQTAISDLFKWRQYPRFAFILPHFSRRLFL